MIDRFVEAQREAYASALEEVKAGRKRGHWMWYIFPQIQGLGRSKTSRFYAIKDSLEAGEYLGHPLLGQRLREICQALLELDTDNPVEVFGHIDALKLRSSMTLFDAVAPNDVFARVLDKYFYGQRDNLTISLLNSLNTDE